MTGEERSGRPCPVAVVMGSQSDWATLRHAAGVLDELAVGHIARIVSAHRTPERLYDFAMGARAAGHAVIVAGAGGAAHLPGMIAAMTTLPVLGVPIETQALRGMDSLLSIVQMPGGVPVGTLAIGKAGAINAGLLAAAILALDDEALRGRLEDWRARQTGAVAPVPNDGVPGDRVPEEGAQGEVVPEAPASAAPMPGAARP